MTRRCEHPIPKPAPPDATTRLAEALLASELHKTPRVLTIKFDEPRDSNTAYRALLALRDGYTPR
jgi:hypothetical protein